MKQARNLSNPEQQAKYNPEPVSLTVPLNALLTTQRKVIAAEDCKPGDVFYDNGKAIELLSVERKTYASDEYLVIAKGSFGANSQFALSKDQKVVFRHWLSKAIFGKSTSLMCLGDIVDGVHVFSEDSRRDFITLSLSCSAVLKCENVEIVADKPILGSTHTGSKSTTFGGLRFLKKSELSQLNGTRALYS